MEERLNDIESDDLSCSVCLNDTIENEQLCNTNCDHNFCNSCPNYYSNLLLFARIPALWTIFLSRLSAS